MDVIVLKVKVLYKMQIRWMITVTALRSWSTCCMLVVGTTAVTTYCWSITHGVISRLYSCCRGSRQGDEGAVFLPKLAYNYCTVAVLAVRTRTNNLSDSWYHSFLVFVFQRTSARLNAFSFGGSQLQVHSLTIYFDHTKVVSCRYTSTTTAAVVPSFWKIKSISGDLELLYYLLRTWTFSRFCPDSWIGRKGPGAMGLVPLWYALLALK